MKNFINTLRNIWKIDDLRVRILNTLGFILIYRLGSYIVLPGVNSEALAQAHKGTNEGIVGLINIFAGGAFSRASVFGLGIMPYISASIVMQLLGMALPYFRKMQMEGETGRKKINQYTRFLTVIITLLQAPGYIATQITNKSGAVSDPSFFWMAQSVLILVTGTMFVMWLGEKITDKGIGNGISLIIMIGIIARLPFAFVSEFGSRLSGEGGGLIMLLIEMVLLLLIIIGSILLVQGTRKIPVQFAKKIVGNKQVWWSTSVHPVKSKCCRCNANQYLHKPLCLYLQQLHSSFLNQLHWQGFAANSLQTIHSFMVQFHMFALLIISIYLFLYCDYQ